MAFENISLECSIHNFLRAIPHHPLTKLDRSLFKLTYSGHKLTMRLKIVGIKIIINRVTQVDLSRTFFAFMNFSK